MEGWSGVEAMIGLAGGHMEGRREQGMIGGREGGMIGGQGE